MKTNQNIRLLDGKKYENVVTLALGGRGLGEGALNKECPKNTPSSVLWTPSPSRGEGHNGFTLIELLVVVLIIGILAGVALPQYNKAVKKARLSEVATTFNSISKGIDMWLLENGWPAGDVISVAFSGNNPDARLDIAQTCATEDSSRCYTKVGRWGYYCYSGNWCQIWLDTSYNADKTTGNKWYSENQPFIVFERYGDKLWTLSGDYVTADVCRWWVQMYGADRVLASGFPSTACNAYL